MAALVKAASLSHKDLLCTGLSNQRSFSVSNTRAQSPKSDFFRFVSFNASFPYDSPSKLTATPNFAKHRLLKRYGRHQFISGNIKSFYDHENHTPPHSDATLEIENTTPRVQSDVSSKHQTIQPIESKSLEHSSSFETQNEQSARRGNVLEVASRKWKNLYERITPRVRGLMLLNLLTFLYGSNISVIKEVQLTFEPAGFTFGRFALATLPFLPLLTTALKDPKMRRAGLELGMWASLGYISQALGVVTTDAGRASFISTFSVIEVPIIAGLMGVKIPRITWFSAAAAVCGVGLLETTGGNTSWSGDLLTFMSAACFGIHVLRSEHFTKHLDEGKSVLPLIGVQLATVTTCSALWALSSSAMSGDFGVLSTAVSGDLDTAFSTILSWPWIQMLYTGIFSTAFCLWIEIVSLKDVTATEASMVYTLEPLYGAGLAWIFLGERWGTKGWFGAALILGGSLVMQIFGKREEKVEKEEDVPSKANTTKALLGIAAIATAFASASLPKGFEPELATKQATVLADSVDLDSFVSLLRICAITTMDTDKDLLDSQHLVPLEAKVDFSVETDCADVE